MSSSNLHIAKACRVLLSVILVLGLLPLASFGFVPQASALSSSDSEVSEWSASASGDSLTITMKGVSYHIQKEIKVAFSDRSTASLIAIMDAQGKSAEIKQDNWASISDSSAVVAVEDLSNYTKSYEATYTIPLSFFGGKDFTLSFGGSSISSVELGIPSAGSDEGGSETSGSENAGGTGGEGSGSEGSDTGSGDSGSEGSNADSEGSGSEGSGAEAGDSASDKSAAPEVSGKYEGIVIDGKFDDWDAVGKTDLDDKDVNGNSKGWSTCEQIAMVWDGDWVYLYFMAEGDQYGCGNWNSVCGAGPYSNGNFVITTDLGNQLPIQLVANNNEPGVFGIDGAQAAVNNKEWQGAPHMWEVAIPASKLPSYSKTISFGLNGVEPAIKGVSDFQGSDEPAGEFSGIQYDGHYEDWKYYPHTTIVYRGASGDYSMVDASGALYSEGDTLYGHAVTSMPEHLDERGGEFLHGVSVRVNNEQDYNKWLKFKYFTLNEDGTINWNPPLSGLSNGTYEYYIAELSTGQNYTTIEQLKEAGQFFGQMKVTVGDVKDECEFKIDEVALANWAGVAPEDMKTIEAQWIRLGEKWVTYAGTSTGPIVLAVCCAALAVYGVVSANRRRKGACATGGSADCATKVE